MDGSHFANLVRKAFRDELGIRFDAGIGRVIGLTRGRVAHILADPLGQSDPVIRKLLAGLPNLKTRTSLLRSWVVSKYAGELEGIDSSAGVLSAAEQKMDEATSMERAAALQTNGYADKTSLLRKATLLRSSVFEIGYAMQDLKHELELHTIAHRVRPLIECHIHRIHLLCHIERIRFSDIQRVVRGLEKLIAENVSAANITSKDSDELREDLQAALCALRLYRFLNSRSNMTHADVNGLCEEVEALSDSPRIPKAVRLGLLTMLISTYTHLKEIDEARRVFTLLSAISRPDDIGLIVLEARLLRAEGHLSASKRALDEAYRLYLREGMQMSAVFTQKELAAVLSDSFPALPTRSSGWNGSIR